VGGKADHTRDVAVDHDEAGVHVGGGHQFGGGEIGYPGT
jgi:hypothetical protein